MLENKTLRRWLRKYIRRNTFADTRILTKAFAKACNIPKQKVAGNLRAMKYDYKTIDISTFTPSSYSVAYLPKM